MNRCVTESALKGKGRRCAGLFLKCTNFGAYEKPYAGVPRSTWNGPKDCFTGIISMRLMFM